MARPSFLSNKIYVCSLCGQEAIGNIDTTCQITCWRCVDFFYASHFPFGHEVDSKHFKIAQDKIKALHRRLVDKGLNEKAKLVHKWILEEKPDIKQCGRSVRPQQRRSR